MKELPGDVSTWVWIVAFIIIALIFLGASAIISFIARIDFIWACAIVAIGLVIYELVD